MKIQTGASSRIRTLVSVARVRHRIVLDDLANDDEGVMNTHDWLGDGVQDSTNRKINTLNAARLQRTEYTSLSNHRWPSVSFVPPDVQTARLPAVALRYAKKGGQALPFPEGTRGFLYYWAQLHLSPMAAGVRFRITKGSHPDTFHEGHDLLLDGLPWQIPLHSIATAKGTASALREQLMRENLVDADQLARCVALTPNKKRLDHRLTVHALNQPFPVDFSKTQFALIAGRTAVKLWQYAYTFADNRSQYRPLVRPYTGSALAQFESSTLPEHAESRTTTLVLRIVNMLQPPECVVPEYDGYIPPPRAGELVCRPMGHARAARLAPWSCDTAGDSESAATLRMLLDK